MLTIDGSYGEGGGQVLRTCLSLSALTGTDITLTNIRAGRKKPGLAAQHLTCVRATAQVCGAAVEGDAFGSQRLVFRPRSPQPGSYVFDVADVRPSAGSVNLILQTVLPVLARCEAPSEVTLRGGTHVAWSPTFDYVNQVFLPAVGELGVQASLSLSKAGYYPQGGGEEVLSVPPSPTWSAARFCEPEGELRYRLISRATRLPDHVADRQMNAMKQVLCDLPGEPDEHLHQTPGFGRGTSVLAATVPGLGGWGGCSALGARGKPAEEVGKEAADAFVAFVESGAAVDLHLADQLLLYAALAEGTTELAVEEITEHARTNMWVIEQFLGPMFGVKEPEDEEPARIAVTGRDSV